MMNQEAFRSAPGALIHSDARQREFVTMHILGQMFGIPVLMVRDVLRGLKVARVPLAPKEIAGSMNLRGRIVTAINMRECLQLPPQAAQDPAKIMCIVVEHKGELFSLIVDSVGEVINLAVNEMEKTPANLSGRWKEVTDGVFKLQGELLLILDVQKLLKF